MLDLQVNGAGGIDLTTEPERVWGVGSVLPRFGVTAFLPTLVDPSWAVVDRAREAFLAGPPAGYDGAEVLGWHVEGPFLAPARAGAHDPLALRAPEVAPIRDWSPASGVRMVTLAPELPAALDVVEALVGNGVVVSAGHSDASEAEATAGFDAGIRSVTHLFNAMPKDPEGPWLPRAALRDERVTIGLIPDGLHVDAPVVALVRHVVGSARLAIVSDAIEALGMPPGRHRLAGREVIVDETSARLPSGVLAGSIIGLEEGVANLARFAGISLDAARLAATTVPARLLGLDWPIAVAAAPPAAAGRSDRAGR